MFGNLFNLDMNIYTFLQFQYILGKCLQIIQKIK